MICDDNMAPGEILLDKEYLRKYNPTIELIDDTKSLILNLRSDDQIRSLCNSGFKNGDSIQVIIDNAFINGINGFVHFN